MKVGHSSGGTMGGIKIYSHHFISSSICRLVQHFNDNTKALPNKVKIVDPSSPAPINYEIF